MPWVWLVILLAGAPSGAISFLPDRAPAFAEWRAGWPDWLEGPCPLTLSPGGVHALDRHTALIHGDLHSAPGAYRSFLVRSEDGGAVWREVMDPMLASSVLDVSFPSPSSGFALVGWVVEGPGILQLHRTVNAGRTWGLVSEVPKPHNLDLPSDLDCAHPLRCVVTLECMEGVGASGHVVATTDGGRTWKARPARATAARDTPRDATAPDGTVWRVAEDGFELRILKRLPTQSWDEVATLPLHFRRAQDGTLEPCARE